MIRVGLFGVSDPRHRWFLAALHRRRAGVRVVGVADGDSSRRDEFCQTYDLPGWTDHRALLTEAGPSLVAIAGPDPGAMIVDALRAGVDVLVAPPVCTSLDQLDMITELAGERRVIAAHTWRGSPAARTAKELISSGKLGHPDLLSLIISDQADQDQQRQLIAEALDVFGWLTGTWDGKPAPLLDDPEEAAAFGTLIATVTGSTAELEIRRRPDLEDQSAIIQVAGDAGAVEWDVRSGLLRSVINGRAPVTVPCGPFRGVDEWVLSNLLRKPRPVITTEQSLATTRTTLSASQD